MPFKKNNIGKLFRVLNSRASTDPSVHKGHLVFFLGILSMKESNDLGYLSCVAKILTKDGKIAYIPYKCIEEINYEYLQEFNR